MAKNVRIHDTLTDAQESGFRPCQRCNPVSPSYFHRLFKATTGVTPKEYATAHRSSRVREKLYERFIAQVVGLVDEPSNRVDLPLDIRGTAFQQKVWQV